MTLCGVVRWMIYFRKCSKARECASVECSRFCRTIYFGNGHITIWGGHGAVSKNKGSHEICQVWHKVTEKGPEKLSGTQERAPGVVVWFEEVRRASAATEVYSGGRP